jgi:hypothetical protein
MASTLSASSVRSPSCRGHGWEAEGDERGTCEDIVEGGWVRWDREKGGGGVQE